MFCVSILISIKFQPACFLCLNPALPPEYKYLFLDVYKYISFSSLSGTFLPIMDCLRIVNSPTCLVSKWIHLGTWKSSSFFAVLCFMKCFIKWYAFWFEKSVKKRGKKINLCPLTENKWFVHYLIKAAHFNRFYFNINLEKQRLVISAQLWTLHTWEPYVAAPHCRKSRLSTNSRFENDFSISVMDQ